MSGLNRPGNKDFRGSQSKQRPMRSFPKFSLWLWQPNTNVFSVNKDF